MNTTTSEKWARSGDRRSASGRVNHETLWPSFATIFDNHRDAGMDLNRPSSAKRSRTRRITKNVAQCAVVIVSVGHNRPRCRLSLIAGRIVMAIMGRAVLMHMPRTRNLLVSGVGLMVMPMPHTTERHKQHRGHQPQGCHAPKPISPLSCRQSFEHAHRALGID